MSDAKKCNRCGRFYDAEYGGRFLVIRKNLFYIPSPIIAGDLCSNCLKDFERFLANKDIYNDEYNGGGWDD